MNDAERFDAVVKQIVGKRLTYAELTGKVNRVRRKRSIEKYRLLPRGKQKSEL
jgi:hypothetical protein